MVWVPIAVVLFEVSIDLFSTGEYETSKGSHLLQEENVTMT
jgi:hypothetical protein